jgi:hypothetical protein
MVVRIPEVLWMTDNFQQGFIKCFSHSMLPSAKIIAFADLAEL